MRVHATRLFVSGLLLIGCGEQGELGHPTTPPDRSSSPPAGTSPVDRPYVVFSERTLVITRLGVPVRPPVSVGSRPSPATLSSEDSSVVEIAQTGELVARGNGRTKIVTLNGEGSVLAVEVKAVDAITLRADALELAPGGSAHLTLADANSGDELPGSSAAWTSSSPERASVLDGVVRAGVASGPVRVTVRYGDVQANVDLVVRPSAASLSVAPAQMRLRVGEVRSFRAYTADGPAVARWTSRDGRVLASIGEGLFQARSTGQTVVCASAYERNACAGVEVTR